MAKELGELKSLDVRSLWSATGRVSPGPVEVAAAGLPRSFSIDDLPAPSPVVVAEHRVFHRIRH